MNLWSLNRQGLQPSQTPQVQQGTRASFLVFCPSLEQSSGAPQTHEMQGLQGEGLAQSFPCSTSETYVRVWHVLTRVQHHIHPTVDMGWHSLLQERGGSGLTRAGGSFGAQALQWGFPALLPSASAQTIKTSHDTDLLSFLKPKTGRTHRKPLRKHAGEYLGFILGQTEGECENALTS